MLTIPLCIQALQHDLPGHHWTVGSFVTQSDTSPVLSLEAFLDVKTDIPGLVFLQDARDAFGGQHAHAVIRFNRQLGSRRECDIGV
jgi:hypothetical protein